MIKNISKDLVKNICECLYQSSEDDRFRYWSNVPDWGGYFTFLKENEKFISNVSFGGMWIENCVPQNWGLATIEWECRMSFFLMCHPDSDNARIKIKEDLLKILKLSEKRGILLESNFCFDKSELSLMMRRAGIALTCGELKLTLLVNDNEQ